LAYIFSRIAGVRVLGDSVLIVADGLSNEVRIFDLSGRFLRSMGGAGQGPGEFESMVGLAGCYSDSVAVLDMAGRVSTFSLDGRFGRRVRVSSTPGGELPAYELACGSEGLLVVNGAGDAGFPRPQGLFWNRSHVFTGTLYGGLSADLGEFPASRHWGVQGVSRLHPFGNRTVFAVGEGTVYLGTSEEHEIRVHDGDGSLTGFIRWSGGDLRLRSGEIEAWVESEVQQTAGVARVRVRGQLESMEYPVSRPSYTQLLLDPLGNLWALQFDPALRSAQEWWVFDPEGVWLGSMSFPPAFRLMDARGQLVAGIETDDLGVERVVVYGLQKGGGGAT
jgi:hypothetical protein